MKVIVLAATKGGPGKTTLAFNLGLEAAKHGTVFLVDSDPQKSLTGICSRREDDSNNPMLIEGVESVSKAVQSLRSTGLGRDWMIVDTPGTLVSAKLRDAIAAADVVVLPIQPSILDMESQLAMTALIGQLGKGQQTVFVFNRVKSGSRELGEVMKWVTHMSVALPNPTLKIADRVEYARGARIGKSGGEIGGAKVGEEMADLWKAVMEIARKTNEDDEAGRGQDTRRAREGGEQRHRRAEAKRTRTTPDVKADSGADPAERGAQREAGAVADGDERGANKARYHH